MDENNTIQLILKELQSQTRYLRQSALLGVVAIVALFVFIGISTYRVLTIEHHKKDTAPSWNQVQLLDDQGKHDEALKMALSILLNSPSDWYSNSYVAAIYLAKGDLINAEKYYAVAYQLFPSDENSKMLIAVRK
jgi:tetratricopeptide (TPR) repeat protein